MGYSDKVERRPAWCLSIHKCGFAAHSGLIRECRNTVVLMCQSWVGRQRVLTRRAAGDPVRSGPAGRWLAAVGSSTIWRPVDDADFSREAGRVGMQAIGRSRRAWEAGAAGLGTTAAATAASTTCMSMGDSRPFHRCCAARLGVSLGRSVGRSMTRGSMGAASPARHLRGCFSDLDGTWSTMSLAHSWSPQRRAGMSVWRRGGGPGRARAGTALLDQRLQQQHRQLRTGGWRRRRPPRAGSAGRGVAHRARRCSAT